LSAQQPQLDGMAGAMYGNSQRVPLDIVGSNGFGRYPEVSSEETFNMVISDGALVDFAGYTLAQTIGGRSRGIYNVVLLNKIACIIDNGFFLIDSNNNVSRVGTLKTSSGNVYLSDNLASQIVAVDGAWVYVYTYKTTPGVFQAFQIASPIAGFSYASPVYVTYQDSRFIVADGNSNYWILSGPSDGTIWPPIIPFANAANTIQTKPCRAMAAVALSRELLVFGQTCCEPWYDAGLQVFPYQRDNFTAIDYGLVNQSTIGELDNAICWLGINEKSNISAFMMYLDNQPKRISNDGLDYIFQGLSNPKDCYGFMYRELGHSYYQLTFVTDNITYLFDLSSDPPAIYTLTDENLNHHIARKVVYFNGSNYFISLVDGNLYKMNSYITNYNGAIIPRIRTTKNIRFPDAARFVIQNINITMESGIAQNYIPDAQNLSDNNSTNYLSNRLDVTLSQDGGYTFYNIASQELPKTGMRRNAFNLYNLGATTNDPVFRFRWNTLGRVVVSGGLISLYR
jgi:hypothetical protein